MFEYMNAVATAHCGSGTHSMAIELNMDALAAAGESIGIVRHQLDEHLGRSTVQPVTLALIATAITRLPVSLSDACRMTPPVVE